MIPDIPPDDVLDNTELVNELTEWIWDRRDRCSPDKMAFLFLVLGAEIVEKHVLNKERIPGLIEAAVQLGRRWGRE